MTQAPMISCPLKQTAEIDWIAPLKAYIRHTYGDDPDRYADECNTLNRLRQDMRGAGKDSAAGRDLLYRYYGQLELLDLRFPVDENHIKISFTWFDAFTHKPTAQYSLAYEKASIIYNISAVLSCHAAHQNRSEDSGLKTAYHSFQASAGMFTYINENFLHAPSTDLSRDTVKTLIGIMLAQGQEVFLEKQIADDKKVGLLAKLASQAAFLYAQAAEGVQENVNKAIFEKVWVGVTQIKHQHMSAVAQYYQAIADNDANSHGVAIARLQLAEGLSKDANRMAAAFPQSVPVNSNLGSETGPNLTEITKRLSSNVRDKLREFIRDNDFIYHQPVPAEAALPMIPKLPAAKAIPVSELYAGQDIQRIIGPDIFQKIVPMSVTESASLYDEEKAKLVRAEAERVEVANGEMAASLDYLKLPGSLKVLKGGLDQDVVVDEEFRGWCEDLAGHEPFGPAFDQLRQDKADVTGMLDRSSKQLDMEESVCEKMRSKYGADWTQQPSSRLTSTLRSDIRNYRGALDEATGSDAQLFATFRQHESDFDEMRSAGETDEAEVLFQRAMVKVGGSKGRRNDGGSPFGGGQEGNLLDDDYGEGGISVMDQIARVEELLKKLNLIKRERTQVLKDLKEKVPLSSSATITIMVVHNDDISNVLILNKKALSSHENQLFQAELEKFRPHQHRLLQANHKQSSLMKELTATYGDLLQDKRVRAEQSKYESLTRQHNSVMSRYKRIYQAFNELNLGLQKAQDFYSEMKGSVESADKNVETFVNNRRSEGAQLLNQIERDKISGSGVQADRERERLKELMERMSMDPSSSSPSKSKTSPPRAQPMPMGSFPSDAYPATSPAAVPRYPSVNMSGKHGMASSPPPPTGYPAYSDPYSTSPHPPPTAHDAYNPSAFSRPDSTQGPSSPPAQQQYFAAAGGQYQYGSPPLQQQHQHQQQQQHQPYLPPGYVPPPPPPGPPPIQPQQSFPAAPPSHGYGAGSGPYGKGAAPGPGRNGGAVGGGDPWAGLSAWK
ncbi:MAG: bck1-like resistance to osmotic shock [Caeruleum heppii]|nr:MAG: bck1-like resistance to osmotic shock [Caeruleum heppii]